MKSQVKEYEEHQLSDLQKSEFYQQLREMVMKAESYNFV